MFEESRQITPEQRAKLILEYPNLLAEKLMELNQLQQDEVVEALTLLYQYWAAPRGSRYSAMAYVLLNKFAELEPKIEDQNTKQLVKEANSLVLQALTNEQRQQLAQQIIDFLKSIDLPEEYPIDGIELLALAIKVYLDLSEHIEPRSKKSHQLERIAKTQRVQQAHQEYLDRVAATKDKLVAPDSVAAVGKTIESIEYYQVVLSAIQVFVETIPDDKAVTATMVAAHLQSKGIKTRTSLDFEASNVRAILRYTGNLDWLRSSTEITKDEFNEVMDALDSFPYQSQMETNIAVDKIRSFYQSIKFETKRSQEIREHVNYWYVTRNDLKRVFPDYIIDFFETYFGTDGGHDSVPKNMIQLISRLLVESENNGIVTQAEISEEIAEEINALFAPFFHPLQKFSARAVQSAIHKHDLSDLYKTNPRESGYYKPNGSNVRIPRVEIFKIVDQNETYSQAAQVIKDRYDIDIEPRNLSTLIRLWKQKQ